MLVFLEKIIFIGGESKMRGSRFYDLGIGDDIFEISQIPFGCKVEREYEWRG